MAPSYVSEARRRGLGTRRDRIGPIVELLALEHGDAEIALNFGSDVELLISVMLSAQTTDVNVNRVTEKLFVKYRRPEDYLVVPIEELELSVRAYNCLKRAGITKVGEVLERLEKGEDEILAIRNFGRKSLNELVQRLDSKGFLSAIAYQPGASSVEPEEESGESEDEL